MVTGPIQRRFDAGAAPASSSTPAAARARPGQLLIAVLPSLATLGNLLCGLLACLCCLLAVRATFGEPIATARHPILIEFFPTWIAVGGYLLVLAMVCDALDGRLARLARRTSEFGAQLDSLADIVSFGAAPMLLFLTLLLTERGADGTAAVSKIEWRLGLGAALVYVSCAGIRLARYNAENTRSESAAQLFRGLPTPGAAGAMIAALLLHADLLREGANAWGVEWASVARWSLGPAAFVLALLMVSRLDYAHVFNLYVRRDRPPTDLVWFAILLGVLWYWPAVALVLLALLYIVSGIVFHGTLRRFASEPADTDADSATDPDR